MKPTTIEEVIVAIPEWHGRSVHAEPVHGGLTNRAFCVHVDGTPHFVSIPGAQSERLAIPRGAEIDNTRAAAETGIAPRVLYQLPESGVLVTEFLQGRTLAKADMHAAGMLERLAEAVRRLHTARPFPNDFDLFLLDRKSTHLNPNHPRSSPPFPTTTLSRSKAAMRAAGMLERLAEAVRRLHTARPFANDFDLFRLMHAYTAVLEADGLSFPPGFEGLRSRLTEMEAAANAHRLPL